MNTGAASWLFARRTLVSALALFLSGLSLIAPSAEAAEPAGNVGTLGRMMNFSGQASVPAGGTFTYGFVVGEGAQKTLLIRAVGPGLAPFGVSGTLAQPVITLFSGSQVVATNSGWGIAPNAADVRTTGARVGAFALTDNSRDSALLVTLNPGNYTIQVSGANNTSGIVLVEVYDVDAKDRVEVAGDRMLADGQRIFRDDTFGSEAFWGGQLRLHQAVAGAALGGVGPGLSAKRALELGLKVDVERVPPAVVNALRAGQVDLDKPDATIDLLKADAVIGLKAITQGGQVTAVGITCALCHSTVDNSFTTGIGRRLDGWPNRDLNIGEIVALAPTVKPFADLLQLDENTIRSVFRSWGPGKYDAILDKDGKAFRPDGRSGATVLPAAFGLAGHHLHTYTGWGSVPYWNAYVAVTQMHGQGTFFDPRLKDATKFPVAARAGLHTIRAEPDLVTSKLPALQAYQLSLVAPEPPAASFNAAAASRGRAVFSGKAKCATCHVPPLYSEPGHALHRGAEIGIDDFQANRSPENAYRTTPLRGLFTREKGGFYHDGRYTDLDAVINHYKPVLGFDLTTSEQSDLVQFLKSL
jgi:hypothetical protein